VDNGRIVEDANTAIDRLFQQQQNPDPEPDPQPDPEPDPQPDPDPPKPKDEIDQIEFPDNASKKAADSFNALKKASSERIAAAEAKTQKAIEETQALRDKLGGKAPEEVVQQLDILEKEVSELRNFKKALDVENSAAFEVFDKRIQRNTDAVCDKLVEWGLSKENAGRIKSIGLTKLGAWWEKINEHLTPAQRQYVERRIAEVESAEIERTDAVKEAKADADNFLKKQAKDVEKASEATDRARKEYADQLMREATWLKYPELDPKATPEQKEAFEKSLPESKKFVDSLREKVNAALGDTSPETHAALAFGNAMSFYLTAHVQFLQKELKAAEDNLKSTSDELAKIKKSSRGRRPGQPTLEPGARKMTDVSEHKPGQRTEDVLDALYAQAQQQQRVS
jgi:hypothetical protein